MLKSREVLSKRYWKNPKSDQIRLSMRYALASMDTIDSPHMMSDESFPRRLAVGRPEASRRRCIDCRHARIGRTRAPAKAECQQTQICQLKGCSALHQIWLWQPMGTPSLFRHPGKSTLNGRIAFQQERMPLEMGTPHPKKPSPNWRRCSSDQTVQSLSRKGMRIRLPVQRLV